MMIIGHQQGPKKTLQTFQKTYNGRCLYWDRMEVAFKIFRLLGYIPYRMDEVTGRMESSRKAWLWTALVSLVQMVMIATGTKMLLRDENWDTYINSLASLARMLFTNTIIFLPIFWWENHKIINYVNEWSIFLRKLDNLTVKPITTSFTRNTFKCTLLVITLVVMCSILTDQLTVQGGFHPFLFLSYLLNFYTSTLITTFWAAHCFFIVQVAKGFLKNLLTELSTTANPMVIEYYRILWLQLRKNALALPEVFKVTMGLHIFINVLGQIFCIYTGSVAAKNVSDIFGFIGLSIPVVWITISLMIICEFSDMVNQEIGQKLIARVLSLNISTQNHGILFTDEINLLLKTLEGNSTDLVLHGCLTINRSLLITVLSSCLTYLIVLLQFDNSKK